MQQSVIYCGAEITSIGSYYISSRTSQFCVHACIPAGLPVSHAALGSAVVFDATGSSGCGDGSGIITRTFGSVHT